MIRYDATQSVSRIVVGTSNELKTTLQDETKISTVTSRSMPGLAIRYNPTPYNIRQHKTIQSNTVSTHAIKDEWSVTHTLHYTTSQYSTVHYITLHYTTSHYTTLH